MDLAVITAQQVAELFILIGLGALGAKTGLLRPEGKQTLSNLLVYLVVPAMIVHSYMMDFSEEILHNLLAAFGLSVLAILIGTVLTLALTARQKDRRAPIFRFASVFSNAAYMGFPLISALFGSEGLLYASAYVTVFNILLWTMGYGMVSGSSSPKEVARSLLRTPVLYAMVVGLAVYLLQIPVPALIAQPLQYSAVLIFQLCALERVHIRPSITFRDAGFSLVRRAGVFIGHFQENQVGKLLKIIAVRYTIISQRIAKSPDFGDDIRRLFTHSDSSVVLNCLVFWAIARILSFIRFSSAV